MDSHRCFGLASMYNLVPRLFLQKVVGIYLYPTLWEGKSLEVHAAKI